MEWEGFLAFEDMIRSVSFTGRGGESKDLRQEEASE